MTTKDNEQIIKNLRTVFGKLETIGPSGPIYGRLCAILDRADDVAIKAIYEANIPFVSALALNRIVRRGLI